MFTSSFQPMAILKWRETSSKRGARASSPTRPAFAKRLRRKQVVEIGLQMAEMRRPLRTRNIWTMPSDMCWMDSEAP